MEKVQRESKNEKRSDMSTRFQGLLQERSSLILQEKSGHSMMIHGILGQSKSLADQSKSLAGKTVRGGMTQELINAPHTL